VLSFGKSNITVKNVYLTLHLQIIYLGVLQRSLNVEFGRWPAVSIFKFWDKKCLRV
jgi:hypothetical protein